MAANSDIGNCQIDEKQGESGSYSYILRIWETVPGRFKGYILDPITGKTYPLVSFSPKGRFYLFQAGFLSNLLVFGWEFGIVNLQAE